MVAIEGKVESGIARVVYTAGVIGTISMLAIGIGISLVGGTTLIDAVGIGAFAALWGGPGFGGMAGGIYYVSREAKRNQNEDASGH
jgi:hypothetical protein